MTKTLSTKKEVKLKEIIVQLEKRVKELENKK